MSKNRELSQIAGIITTTHVVSDSADFSGNVTALSFNGDGSSLTGIESYDSAKVTGQFDSAFPSAFDTRFAAQDTHDSVAVQGQFDSAFPVSFDARFATKDTHDSVAVQGQIDSAFPSAFDTRFATKTLHDSVATQGQFDSASAYYRVASGTIADGNLLIRNSNDTVSAFAGANTMTLPGGGPSEVFDTDPVFSPDVAYDSDNDVYVVVGSRTWDDTEIIARVATVSNDSVSWGDETVIFSSSADSVDALCITSITGGKVAVCYADPGNNDYGTARIGTISGTDISFGNATAFTTTAVTHLNAVWQTAGSPYGTGLIVSQYRISNAAVVASIGTVSGTNVSFNTGQNIVSVTPVADRLFYDNGTQTLMYVYTDATDKELHVQLGAAIVGSNLSTWPGSLDLATSFDDIDVFSVDYDETNTRYMVTFASGNQLYSTSVSIASASNGSITDPELSLDLTGEASVITDIETAYNADDDTFGVYYKTSDSVDYVTDATSTGTNLNVSSSNRIEISDKWNGNDSFDTRMLWDTTSSRYLLVGRDLNESLLGDISAVMANLSFSLGSFNANVDNFLGVASGNYTNGQTAKVIIDGEVRGGYSSLTYGDFYYAKEDGTIASTPISGGATPANLTMPIGRAISATEILLEVGNTVDIATTFSENATFSSGVDVTGAFNVTGNVVVSGTAIAATQTASISGATTLDFSTYQNFVLTLTGATTLSNPTTETVGQSGFIVFIQDGTGNRTVSLGTDFETAGATGLYLSSSASTTDIVPYIVTASGRILLGTPQLAFG
jgi:hypothetical protein